MNNIQRTPQTADGRKLSVDNRRFNKYCTSSSNYEVPMYYYLLKYLIFMYGMFTKYHAVILSEISYSI